MEQLSESEVCRTRRERGWAVLNAYGRMTGDDQLASGQAALAGLLGDLLHASDLLGLSFVEALRRAAVEKRCEVLAEIEDAFHRRPAAAPHSGDPQTGP